MSYFYPLVVFVSMLLGDVGSTAKIKFVTDGKRFRADMAEAWSDVCTLGSVGVGAVQIFKSGAVVGSAIVVALIAGAMVGTEIGQRLAARWDLPHA